MIRWREKFRAFGVHFAITATIAAAAAWLVFGVWFPEPFDALAGGSKLFLLISSCDLVLGPLLSLVVYDSQKSRGKLVFDYAVIAILQLGSLLYGLSVVSASRPVYVAFVGDRLELVSASMLKPAELAAARDPAYRSVPRWGVRYVAIRVPPEDHNDALFESLAGNEEAGRPRFYVPYDSRRDDILSRARALEELERRHPEGAAQIAAARAAAGVPAERLRWLPVRTNQEEFWTALIDARTARPVHYIELDPY
jgi:hypothetical protein